jgi:phosphoglycerate dehydrogenase-like enzyme
VTRLLIYGPSYSRIKAEVSAAAPDLEVLVMDEGGVIRLDGTEIAPGDADPTLAWANHDVFFSPPARHFFISLLKAPRLAWVQSAAAGFDNPAFGEIVRKGAKLSTSHGQAVGMADYVMAGVLDHFQRGPERRAAQKAHGWWHEGFREVADTSWLIIGYGAIGQGVARRAQAFGAKVVGVRRDASASPFAERIVDLGALADELPRADVVVLSIPLNAHTRHLAGAAFFAAMKPGSVLVNVGRGGLVDEPALLAALDAGIPEHAVLDVFETEPLPADSPFWDHPRVSLTGHCSGVTGGENARNQALFLDNLTRFVSGAPLLNLADPKDVFAARD